MRYGKFVSNYICSYYQYFLIHSMSIVQIDCLITTYGGCVLTKGVWVHLKVWWQWIQHCIYSIVSAFIEIYHFHLIVICVYYLLSIYLFSLTIYIITRSFNWMAITTVNMFKQNGWHLMKGQSTVAHEPNGTRGRWTWWIW